jgi:cation diffusion facilitator family transporter
MQSYKTAIGVQKWITLLGFVLLGIKFWAFFLTNSVAILTDALESIVNVTAGTITLLSLMVAAKPRDSSHPYGHGKAEFISAGIEGTLITLAGLLIFYEAGKKLFNPGEVSSLDTGLILISISGIVNLLAGLFAIKTGKKTNSLGITATGKHLISDAVSTAGLVTGLIILYFTGWQWIDSVVAFLFGGMIIYTGYKIVRTSIAGIMDESDEELLNNLVKYLDRNRMENWIDLHNLRVIKYGNQLHIDCHLTLPWYMNLNEAHIEIDSLSRLIKEEFGDLIELFVHTDGCLPFSCKICNKQDCTVRKHPFKEKIEWTNINLFENQKHEFHYQ